MGVFYSNITIQHKNIYSVLKGFKETAHRLGMYTFFAPLKLVKNMVIDMMFDIRIIYNNSMAFLVQRRLYDTNTHLLWCLCCCWAWTIRHVFCHSRLPNHQVNWRSTERNTLTFYRLMCMHTWWLCWQRSQLGTHYMWRVVFVALPDALTWCMVCTMKALLSHYIDVIMTTMASQITSLTVVYSIVYSGADQRKHQRSASLAFVRGNSPGTVNSPYKWPVTRKMFPFYDVITTEYFLGLVKIDLTNVLADVDD